MSVWSRNRHWFGSKLPQGKATYYKWSYSKYKYILGDEQRTRDEISAGISLPVFSGEFVCCNRNCCWLSSYSPAMPPTSSPSGFAIVFRNNLFRVQTCRFVVCCQTLCYAPKLITIKTVNAMITRDAELVSQDVSLSTTFIWRLICINSLERSTRWDEIRGTERKPEVVFVKWDYRGRTLPWEAVIRGSCCLVGWWCHMA